MPLSDNELIINIIKGNSSMFEELVYRYDRKVLSLAMKYAQNEDDAKDIYQEVFIRVFRGLKNFKFKSEFSTWLFRITTNACITYKLKQNKRQLISINQENENGEQYDIPSDSNESSPQNYSEDLEVSDNIKEALEQLPPRQKMIFILKHYEGYKIREIAEMMDIGEGTVKKYLFEAVHRLRELLKAVYK